MITATFDLISGWTVHGEPDPYGMFAVRFSSGDTHRIFVESLSFGWSHNGVDYSWPPANTVVREITPERVFEFHTNAQSDDNVTIDLWAKNADVQVSSQMSWVVPRPAKPYPSWVWMENRWVSPIPYPDDGGRYKWDEDVENWVPFGA